MLYVCYGLNRVLPNFTCGISHPNVTVFETSCARIPDHWTVGAAGALRLEPVIPDGTAIETKTTLTISSLSGHTASSAFQIAPFSRLFPFRSLPSLVSFLTSDTFWFFCWFQLISPAIHTFWKARSLRLQSTFLHTVSSKVMLSSLRVSNALPVSMMPQSRMQGPAGPLPGPLRTASHGLLPATSSRPLQLRHPIKCILPGEPAPTAPPFTLLSSFSILLTAI